MRTLNLYIARLYLTNIAVMVVVLFSFVVAVDVAMNMGRFWNAARNRMEEREARFGAHEAPEASAAADGGGNEGGERRRGREAGGLRRVVATAWVIWDLWWPRLMQLFNHLIGVVLIAAMGFTCAQLSRHREFVAMMASGLSLFRVARPMIAVAALITLLALANQEVLVPRLAHRLVRDTGDAGKEGPDAFRVRLAPDEAGLLLLAQKFDDQAGVLERLTVWERDASGRVVRVITADRGVWDGRGWALENGVSRGRVETTTGRVVQEPVARLETTLDPMRLKVRYLQGFGQALSWRQVSAILRHGGLDAAASRRLDLVRWGHVAAMVSGMVTLLAAMPFFLVRVPGPMLWPALKAAPIALAGLVAAALSSTVILPGLPVWLGTFVPSLVLMPLAIALFSGVKT